MFSYKNSVKQGCVCSGRTGNCIHSNIDPTGEITSGNEAVKIGPETVSM